MLRAARVIVWDYDLRTRVTAVDLDSEAFGIRPPPRIALRTALAFVQKEDRRALWTRTCAAFERGEPYVHQLRVGLGIGGDYLWMENHATVARDTDGQPVRVTGIMIDVTSHKRAADALLENDRRKDAFLATLAHELRNPLASVVAASHSLGHAQLDPARSHACVQIIRRQSQHLSRLIDDLLDVGRITQNRLVLEQIRLDIRGCVREAVEMVQHLAETAHHTLSVATLPEPVPVHADHVRIVQVFANLLTNAIKYTPPPGRIDVVVRRENAQVVVRVCDNGLGIAVDKQPHVFEPFYQVASPEARSSGGLGIGLALARRIVELHGGKIELHSAGLGKGCEFAVHLPVLSGLALDDIASGNAPMPTDRADVAPFDSHRLRPAKID